MAEDPSSLESTSAEVLLSMKEKKVSNSYPMATSPRAGRIRKPKKMFGSDDESLPVTPKPRKQTKLSSVKGVMSTPDKRVAQSIGGRLRNILKLPKAHVWVCYEWFYSNIDKAIFEGENEFSNCLKEAFPQLKTRKLTRLQWSKIRRLMGKPRRCSPSFFNEERLALQRKRHKIRLLQQRKAADVTDFKDLPEEIPMPLVIGTHVTARLRKPQDGLFGGVIDALDTVNNTYRITFDRTGLGTHSVPDIDVLSDDVQETMPLSSFYTRKRPVRQTLFSSPNYTGSMASPHLNNDPLLSCTPGIGDHDTVGGIPVKFLVLVKRLPDWKRIKLSRDVQLSKAKEFTREEPVPDYESPHVTRLTKLLGVKKDVIQKVKEMNTEAEKMKSYGDDYDMPFQQRYAGLILELERINKDLNDYLIGVQQCLHEIDPEKGMALLDQPSEIRKKCQAEAETIVKKTNIIQGRKRVRNERSVHLVTKMMSLLLQIRTFADSEMHSFEFKSLQDSLDEIKAAVDPSNVSVFQNNVEIHIHHIQNGLTQTGNLHAFAVSHC